MPLSDDAELQLLANNDENEQHDIKYLEIPYGVPARIASFSDFETLVALRGINRIFNEMVDDLFIKNLIAHLSMGKHRFFLNFANQTFNGCVRYQACVPENVIQMPFFEQNDAILKILDDPISQEFNRINALVTNQNASRILKIKASKFDATGFSIHPFVWCAWLLCIAAMVVCLVNTTSRNLGAEVEGAYFDEKHGNYYCNRWKYNCDQQNSTTESFNIYADGFGMFAEGDEECLSMHYYHGDRLNAAIISKLCNIALGGCTAFRQTFTSSVISANFGQPIVSCLAEPILLEKFQSIFGCILGPLLLISSFIHCIKKVFEVCSSSDSTKTPDCKVKKIPEGLMLGIHGFFSSRTTNVQPHATVNIPPSAAAA